MMLAQPNRLLVVVSITKQETCLYLLVQRRIEATYLFFDLGTTWSHFGRGSVCMGGTSSLEVLLRPYAPQGVARNKHSPLRFFPVQHS